MYKLLTPSKLSLLILLLLLYAPLVMAQEAESTPRKFDEFGEVSNEDILARLDFFAIKIQKRPGSKGYVIAYGIGGHGAGSGNAVLEITKEYLITSRGLSGSQVETIFGGKNPPKNLPQMELWIGDKDGPLPPLRQMEPSTSDFKGLFKEFSEFDEIGRFEVEEDGSVLSFAADAAFVDLLGRQKKSTGFLIGYNGEEAVPGAWRRVAQRRLSDLEKNFGLEKGRIQIVFGGISKDTKSELWILPTGESLPLKQVGPEALPKKAVLVASVNEMMWKGYERATLNRLIDVLDEYKTLRVCLIVQPRSGGSGVSGTKKLNLQRITESWRLELVKKRGLARNRFVVLHAKPTDETYPGIDVWVVPPGASLPDSNN